MEKHKKKSGKLNKEAETFWRVVVGSESCGLKLAEEMSGCVLTLL